MWAITVGATRCPDHEKLNPVHQSDAAISRFAVVRVRVRVLDRKQIALEEPDQIGEIDSVPPDVAQPLPRILGEQRHCIYTRIYKRAVADALR